jgi:UDP-N-acetylmuramoylalanine--D-glutamate ligase
MTVRSLPPHSAGEVAVLGLGASGVAAAMLLRSMGYAVYASDRADSPTARGSAATLGDAGETVQTGGHDRARVARAALVVVSPGIPPNAPPVVTAMNAERELISEIELALRAPGAMRYIAITGTNGKTTTTALVAHLLRAVGAAAVEAGNIGTPLSRVVLADPPPQWVSLELSSFQLHDTPSIEPAVGVLTNLSSDHLDRYPTVEAYFADKALLFQNATSRSRWVLNADDPASLDMARGVDGEHVHFSVRGEADAWYDRASGVLRVLGHDILPRAELALLGDHNVANALAAVLAVMTASDEHRTADVRACLADGLRSFRALAHRLELVGEWNGVQWINDSKATNVSSTYVAVAGMTRPTILLLGGRHKGEPYTSLGAPIREHVRHIIAFGEAAPHVLHDLGDEFPVEHVSGSFEEVMTRARAVANSGDAVLLSPACSSFDMFRNYMERGERFRTLAAG